MLGRKRNRSTECSFVGQSKHFINQNMVNARNADKMNEIYNKTVSMLFKGVNEHFHLLNAAVPSLVEDNNNETEVPLPKSADKVEDRIKLVRLLGGGQFVALSGQKVACIPAEADLNCISCSRKSRLQGECLQCNVELCESCGYSCVECNLPLCSSCVNLFDCGSPDSPCCSQCKMYAA